MPDVRIDRSDRPRLVVSAGERSVVVDEIVRVLTPDGTPTIVPVVDAEKDGDTVVVRGGTGDWSATASWESWGDIALVRLSIAYTPGDRRAAPKDAGVRLQLRLPGRAAEPHWLVPGVFYRHNRFAECTRIYPRAVSSGGDVDRLESPTWSFRSDRAAVPAVLGWTDTASVGLATDPRSALGMHGMGFALDVGPGAADPNGGGSSARIWLDLPYREEPVVFDGTPTPAPPDVRSHRWAPGEQHTVTCCVTIGPPDPHAYDPFVRFLYARDARSNPTAPWMTPAEGAALTAAGLHRWHWRPEHDVLIETAAFDRAQPELDRLHMHVGWVSGVPWAHALLDYGRRTGHGDYVEAAGRVLDKITGARTPAGTIWGMWTADRGWRCGWNPDPAWLHARTLAEATLFLVRAALLERRHGVDRPGWITAVADNLRFVLDRQDGDGDFGAYYDHRTGEVTDRRSAAGILWIAALVEAVALSGTATAGNDDAADGTWPSDLDADRLLTAARRAGDHYAGFVEDAFLYGAPEDVHLAPTSEDGVNAILAYMALFGADGDARWLSLAARAADWMLTFRYTYNVAFDDHTLLGHYDFRSRGADQASPSNQHLGSYGLLCLGELVHLARATGDDHYLERARDNLDCFLQFIAREDGDFNAGKGMVSERYYQTNCFQAKGSLLTLSHAWCVGVALHGCLVAMDEPTLADIAPTDPHPTHRRGR